MEREREERKEQAAALEEKRKKEEEKQKLEEAARVSTIVFHYVCLCLTLCHLQDVTPGQFL